MFYRVFKIWASLASGVISTSIEEFMKCYNQHVRKLKMVTIIEAAIFIMFNMHVHICMGEYLVLEIILTDKYHIYRTKEFWQ